MAAVAAVAVAVAEAEAKRAPSGADTGAEDKAGMSQYLLPQHAQDRNTCMSTHSQLTCHEHHAVLADQPPLSVIPKQLVVRIVWLVERPATWGLTLLLLLRGLRIELEVFECAQISQPQALQADGKPQNVSQVGVVLGVSKDDLAPEPPS